mmetsp:Transcript_5912/g.11198  ORF Transcript_5912/g.11198 Transcript_5912/m.11198 type:complete len:303 (+) Transcript_5912:91-999(+)
MGFLSASTGIGGAAEVAVCGAGFVAGMIGLMVVAKYWFAKRFPTFDRLTKDNEYLGFLIVCLTYQALILPSLIAVLLYTNDVSRIDWWLSSVNLNDGVNPIVAVLCAHGAYNIKDFWFEHAIAEGDVAMWLHHFVSLGLLAAPMFGLVANAGATAMGVFTLEVGSMMWNTLCVAKAFNWDTALLVIRPLFLLIMLWSNIATLVILGATWGVPDHRRNYGIGECVATFAILQLVLGRMDNAVKIEADLARKLFGECFCPAAEKTGLSDRKRFATIGAMGVVTLVLSAFATEAWLAASGLFSEA